MSLDRRSIGFVLVAAVIAVGCEELAESEMDRIEDEVAEDQVKQYKLAEKGGDKMEICVNAGIVAAAYKQADDEKNYLKWKDKEKADCKAAGLPQ